MKIISSEKPNLKTARLYAAFFVFLSFAFACNSIPQQPNNIAVSKTNFAETTNIKPPAKPNSDDDNIFLSNLPENFPVPTEDEEAENRILKEYGAVFVARGDSAIPPKIIFADEEEVSAWQNQIPTRRENFGVPIMLQEPAMNALIAARDEAKSRNLKITARGTWAARRDYRDTLKIWLTRIVPGLAYWQSHGKISAAEAQRIRQSPPVEQITQILQLEKKKFFFSKDFSKSVLLSATPPGASQHLSMLAFDVNENGNSEIRAILAKHGWFQTVESDLPHFTFIGVPESELLALGLRKIVSDNRAYWKPAL